MKDLTIKDVADKLGYSVGTISRALNGKKGVSEQTRRKILAEMDAMGYESEKLFPTESMALTSGIKANPSLTLASRVVAAIIPDISNAFFGRIIRSFENALEQLGYHTLLMDSNWDPKRETELLQIAQSSNTAGILFKPASSNVSLMKPINIPCVMINQEYSDDFTWVDIDNFYAGYVGTEHLILGGCRRIAFINGYPDNVVLRKRIMGYKAALSDYGIPFDERLILNSPHSIKDGYRTTVEILKKSADIDAFFCCDDLHAIGAMACVQDKGLKIPEDVAIIGFNNSDMADLPQIQLTSISQPTEQIGILSAQMLVNIIENQERGMQWFPQKSLLTPALVVRGTTRPVNPELKRKTDLEME